MLQETLLAAWRGIGGFSGESSLKTWLFGIARRKTADYYRSRAPYVPLDEGAESDGEAALARAADRADLERAVAALPPADRELLILVFRAQLTYAEVAALTGVPSGTVKSRMSAIRAKLAKFLGGMEHE